MTKLTLPTPRYKMQNHKENEKISYIGYLTRGFFAPRLNTSTSALLRDIIGFATLGAGLPVLERGAECVRGGGADGDDGFGFEIIELMMSDGLGAGRAEDDGGEADKGCGLDLAEDWGSRDDDAGLLQSCREGSNFDDRGGDEDDAGPRGRGSLGSSKRSSTSSRSSSSSSSDEPTNVSFKPPSFLELVPDVNALNLRSLSSKDGALIPLIPPENFPTGFCFLDNILNAG
jgi:hypothetical protein